MARPHFRPPEFPHRPGLVAPVRVDPSGRSGPTPDQARGPHWRRTSQGFYVPSSVSAELPEQRILEAAAVLPSYGGVTGWAALRWLGGRWFSGLAHGGRTVLPVSLATSCADVRSQQGIQVSAEGLDPRDLIEHDGLRLTSAVRSVCFEMRYATSQRLAVVALDMAAFDDLVSIDEVEQYVRSHSGWTGIPRARGATPLGDENCWSPPEALMRCVWTEDRRFPRPLCNQPLFDRSGQHLGTPDLVDPLAGVVGEYDGRHHLELAQRTKDVDREDAYRSMGLESVTMLAGDLADPRRFRARLEVAYRRARWLDESTRPWTLEQPPWWVDTSSVAARRALTREQRDLWLRRRAS